MQRKSYKNPKSAFPPISKLNAEHKEQETVTSVCTWPVNSRASFLRYCCLKIIRTDQTLGGFGLPAVPTEGGAEQRKTGSLIKDRVGAIGLITGERTVGENETQSCPHIKYTDKCAGGNQQAVERIDD